MENLGSNGIENQKQNVGYVSSCGCHVVSNDIPQNLDGMG